MKYYSIGEFADKIGKTIQTLRNWDKNNTFKPAYVTTGGTRYYSQEQLNNFLGLKIKTKILNCNKKLHTFKKSSCINLIKLILE